MRVKWAPAARPAARDHRAHAPVRRGRSGLAILAVLTIGLAGGCGVFGGSKPAGDKAAAEKKPLDSPAALRQDIDRLRADITDLRTRVESAQRAGTESADRVGRETRAEFDAMQKAMEASARNDVQRQVEVLDAQAHRIDLLEKRATEMAQALRRIELSLGGLESQLSRILEGTHPPSAGTGARRSAAPRAPGEAAATPSPARGSDDTPSAASPSDGSAPTAAAGAGLVPPAMLGTARNAKGPTAPADASRTPSPAKPTSGEGPRVAKTAPSAAADKTAPSHPAKGGALASAASAGSPGARALFDRGMDNWNKGERGQAVLDFEELIQNYPSDPLAASAQFRVGEAYYVARDFERAAQEYRKAVDLAPKGKDTPQALLRLGLAYRAQRKEADARQAWTQLIRDFPDSDVTEEARRALAGR